MAEEDLQKEHGSGSEPPQKEFEKPIDKMTVKELREIAKNLPGVEGVHAMKKEELLQILKEEHGIEGEKPAKKVKKTDEPLPSAKELKKRISRLKQERDAARKALDRKRLDVLRRRINRLKKQTRKVARV